MVFTLITVLVTADFQKSMIAVLVIIVSTMYAMAIWTIYGYNLYGSSDNNCSMIRETNGWSTLMLIFLVFGSVIVLYASILTCVIPCIVIAMLAAFRRDS